MQLIRSSNEKMQARDTDLIGVENTTEVHMDVLHLQRDNICASMKKMEYKLRSSPKQYM